MHSKNDLDLFSKPLILGASISADWAAMSPGKRLAHRHNQESQVQVLARGGQTGASVLGLLRSHDLDDRSIVIGFDLFFWDSTRADVSASLKKMEALVADAEKRKLPLVIGDIPELAPGFQPARKVLNKKLRELAAKSPLMRLIPLEKLYLQVLADGFVEIRGQRFTFFDLVPDGLHIGDVAADFLADLVYETIRSRPEKEVSA